MLDAASVHYLAQKEVYMPPYSAAFRDKINTRKEEEIRLADRILTLSGYAKETYVRSCIPEHKITVIPPGVDGRRFAMEKKKRTRNSFKYLFVGNIKPAKGVDILLNAFNRIEAPGKKLTIIGAMGDAAHLLGNRQNNIAVKGYVPHEKLPEEYNDADIFILPSRLDGFGLVVTEAMSTATPVIVSSHVGAKDLVNDGVSGWVFESGDHEALADAMQKAYDNRDRLVSMGEKAREAVSLYTWEAYRENIRRFYSSLFETTQ